MFITCFAALVATSFCFVLRAFVIDDWGHEFGLSATQKGELLGVGLWPFSISIVLLSLLIDRVGFRAVLWFAVACHLIGTGVTVFASGYWSLYIGTFVLALGNGAVEAAVNPLIATAYRHDKTKWLNMLHAGWPGRPGARRTAGARAGRRRRLALEDRARDRSRHRVLAAAAAPAFPVSERVAAGVSYRDMLAEAGYVSALIVASLIVIEIGRVFAWPTALQIVLIAALTGVLCVLHALAGSTAVHRHAADHGAARDDRARHGQLDHFAHGTRDGSHGAAAGLGARLHVRADARAATVRGSARASLLAARTCLRCARRSRPSVSTACPSRRASRSSLAATLYGLGKSFFWPTSIGFVAEQFPKGGAVTMNVLAGVGMLAVGIVGSVLLGAIQDRSIGDSLAAHDAQHGTQLHATFFTQEKTGVFGTLSRAR